MLFCEITPPSIYKGKRRGKSELVLIMPWKGGDILERNEIERQARKHRRKVIDSWKKAAKSIKETAESAGQKMLRREALTIIEDAARTQKDFEDVLIIWGKLEQNEAERIADHESGRPEELLDWKVADQGVYIPQPIDRIYFKQEIKGNFLDTIYDCPHELHEMTACKPASGLVEALSELHKELLYYRVIRRWSIQQIAIIRDKTDRNILKMYTKVMDTIRYELFYYLYWRYKKRLLLTTNQRRFVIAHIKVYGAAENREVEWALNEGDEVETDEKGEEQ